MKTRIYLGEKPEMFLAGQNEQKEYYPRLHIKGGEELKDFPKEGKLVVEFKRESLATIEEDDKERVSVSVCLEVTCICDVKEGKTSESTDMKVKKTEDELDRLLSEAQEEDGEMEDDEEIED